MSRDMTPDKSVATPPPLPTSKHAYRRALAEARCAELCAAIYTVSHLDTPGFAEFTHPLGLKGEAATLRAFGFVEDGVAFICFRGTDRLRNWGTNLHLEPTGDPKRHAGFYGAWRKLQPQITAWLERTPSRELVITGHSLGGAMAQMAAFELAALWPIAAVVCFGAPLIGWQAFARAYESTTLYGRPQRTLGDVTTTFVFKSDLVRTFLLPRLGCQRLGLEIVIDETGRPNNAFAPWYVDALSTTYTAIAGEDADPASGFRMGGSAFSAARVLPAAEAREAGSFGPLPSAPPLTLRMVVDGIRPVGAVAVKALPQLQAAVFGVGAAMAAYLSARFFFRDVGYHSAGQRYAIALKARVERWVPLAYLEHGQELLASGDAVGAVAYLRQALDTADADARSAGVCSPALEQLTWRPRLTLAAAHAAQRDYQAAIVCLSALIAAFPPAREVAVGPDGTFSISPQVAAIQRRAVIYESAGRFAEAMADCATILSLKPDLNFDAYVVLRRRAQKIFGVANLVASAFDARGAKVKAETDRLLDQRRAAFERNMAPTWAWAHLHRAAGAYRLSDHATVIAEADAALALGAKGAAPYTLRASSNEALGKFDEALADRTRAIEAVPANPTHYYERARARLMAHATGQQRTDEPGRVWLDLSITQADLDLVRQDLRRTLQLSPSHEGAGAWLDRLVEATGSAPPAAASTS